MLVHCVHEHHDSLLYCNSMYILPDFRFFTWGYTLLVLNFNPYH